MSNLMSGARILLECLVQKTSTACSAIRAVSPCRSTTPCTTTRCATSWCVGRRSAAARPLDPDTVYKIAKPHLDEIATLGCRRFQDATPNFVGRNTRLLRRLSDATGITCDGGERTAPGRNGLQLGAGGNVPGGTPCGETVCCTTRPKENSPVDPVPDPIPGRSGDEVDTSLLAPASNPSKGNRNDNRNYGLCRTRFQDIGRRRA